MNLMALTKREKEVLEELKRGCSLPFSFVESDRKNTAKRKILRSLVYKGFVRAETKTDGIHYFPIDLQKQIDDLYNTLYCHWVEKGFNYREAEILCFLDRLPEEEIPTKYKELKKRSEQV